jgi:hypothetical protein
LDLWQFAKLPCGRRHLEGNYARRRQRATQRAIELKEPKSVGGISDRKQEIKRRRHRRKKLLKLSGRLKKATFSEKQVIAAKIRNLTPGAEVIIANWGLQEQDR